MNREELNKFLGKKVEITLYDTDVYTGFLVLSSDYGYFKKYPPIDIMYVLIDESAKTPICIFDFEQVTKCTIVPELESNSRISLNNIRVQEYRNVKTKETPMLVDCSNFTYKEFADGKLYFCPKCCNMIKKSYFYCPTCGQNLLWADMNDIRTTIEVGENADRKD